jgi:hypothetical protein
LSGYAGTPFLLAIPCFYFSTLASIRVYKAHKNSKRNHDSISPTHSIFPTQPTFTIPPPPTVRQARNKSRLTLPEPLHVPVMPSPKPSVNWSLPVSPPTRKRPTSARTMYAGKAPSSPVLSNHQFHLPLTPSLHDLASLPDFSEPHMSDEPRGDGDSSISMGLPTFAPMINKPPDVFRGFGETPPFLPPFTVGRDDRNGSGELGTNKSSSIGDREKMPESGIANFATRRRMSSRE